ncbi:universal stress protein [Kallotenue papyrolyticum]|uniref:universal stress protein n=1 Tax=Kallotenue papyrolyticum TaxID=1325125 RepID=UPI003B83895A
MLPRALAPTPEQISRLLAQSEHHLLLVGAETRLPERLLICVAGGEPGKDDIRFAARLARHLGAQVSLLAVVPPDASPDHHARVQRFLEAGQRTARLFGIQADTLLRSGVPHNAISAVMAEGQHDMLVLGAPLRLPITPGSVAGQLLAATPAYPVLIVRSTYAHRPTDERALLVEEYTR